MIKGTLIIILIVFHHREEENGMKESDTYLDEFRENTSSTVAPKKRLGFYSTKEVDRLISDMKSKQEN